MPFRNCEVRTTTVHVLCERALWSDLIKFNWMIITKQGVMSDMQTTLRLSREAVWKKCSFFVTEILKMIKILQQLKSYWSILRKFY